MPEGHAARRRVGHSLRRSLALGALLILPTLCLAQISPGPLASAHAHLEGTSNCFACHGAGEDSLDNHCLNCHEGINQLVTTGRGLHGRLGGETCDHCHPDHAGEQFEMIAWEEGSEEKFLHRRTGWTLDGKHSSLACRDCHKPQFQVDPVVALLKTTDHSRRWVGLSQECIGCHQDRHEGALGNDCAQCHVPASWNQTTPFDHQLARFPLEGAHGKVECDGCHLAPRLGIKHDDAGRPLPVFRPVPHGECSQCHEDPHDNRLGPSCSDCHTPEGFQQVRDETFDHSRTAYPLRGLHRRVECSQCHGPPARRVKRPASARCTDCHEDYHQAELGPRGQAPDCADCHRVEGWTPSTFDLERHQKTDYPLEGLHAELACAKCHRDESAAPKVRLRPEHTECLSCHQAAHGDQLAARQHGGACETCHTPAGFKPSNFTAAEHAGLRFPLEGAHASALCAGCHGPERPGLPPLPEHELLGPAGVALALGPIACTACHVDSHAGAFAQRPGHPELAECISCHGPDSFKPSRVDTSYHADLGFALEGAHQAVPCMACHEELLAPRGESTLLLAADTVAVLPFGQRRQRCAECHEDVHDGQFGHRGEQGECAACHGTESFVPATGFDHETDAAFKLGGAHAKVACEKCHLTGMDEQGSSRRVYRPTPTECRECHGAGHLNAPTVDLVSQGR